MKFRFSCPGIVSMTLVLTASAQAPRGLGQIGGPVVVTTMPASVSSISSGLLVDVVGENQAPLDRQAVVKALNKNTQKVVWQTTGHEAERRIGLLLRRASVWGGLPVSFTIRV